MKTDLMATTWTCRKTGHSIQVSSINKDGSCVFSVRNQAQACLNKELEWEYEPMPSNRSDEFLERCRFDDFGKARNALEAAVA